MNRPHFPTGRGHDPDPLAQVEVEREIMRLSRVLTEITEDVAEAATEQARTEVAFKVAHARAILAARDESGTVQVKEAMAHDACASEFEAMKMAEAVYKACQESGRNVRSQLDALRSINANVRAAVTWAHGEGG